MARINDELWGDNWHNNAELTGGKHIDHCDKTMARKAILESHGISVIEIWGNEWEAIQDPGNQYRE